jgi:5'-nucleotidase
MQIKNILITSDDGYNSLGVRLLAKLLKDRFHLVISATKDQQSGVGGKINLEADKKWSVEKVEGVKALCIESTPVDAVEAAHAYFKKEFDLIISGINMGQNVSGSLISSGTFAAAWRSLSLGMTQKAVALSWASPPESFFYQHSGKETIAEKYFTCPGEMIEKVLDLVIKHDFWQTPLLNINFPSQKSNKVKFVRPLPDITQYWKYPSVLDAKTHLFQYSPGFSDHPSYDTSFDGPALDKGFITITPCQADFTNEKVYHKLKDKIISL